MIAVRRDGGRLGLSLARRARARRQVGAARLVRPAARRHLLGGRASPRPAWPGLFFSSFLQPSGAGSSIPSSPIRRIWHGRRRTSWHVHPWHYYFGLLLCVPRKTGPGLDGGAILGLGPRRSRRRPHARHIPAWHRRLLGSWPLLRGADGGRLRGDSVQDAVVCHRLPSRAACCLPASARRIVDARPQRRSAGRRRPRSLVAAVASPRLAGVVRELSLRGRSAQPVRLRAHGHRRLRDRPACRDPCAGASASAWRCRSR